MRGYEGYKVHAVEARLQRAIKQVVERYRTDGAVLTWPLVHKIEREAIQILEQAGDLERKYIRMMRTSRWGSIPKVNQPVELDRSDELPLTLTMIDDAYRSFH